VGKAQSGGEKEDGEGWCQVTREQLLVTIEGERSALVAHQEQLKPKNTPSLKWHCQQALHYLEDAEGYSKPPKPIWEIVNFAMGQAAIHRKVVDDAVASHGGYNLEEI
jgi:hypothetical protein